MPCRYYSPCPLGLEEALLYELRALGAEDLRPQPGGVEYLGDRALGYRACMWLRTAIRVQEVLFSCTADSREDFYSNAKQYDWTQILEVDQTFQIDGNVRDSKVTHSKFASLVLKDAIADHFRDRIGRRPSVDRHGAHVPLRLLIRDDEAVISRDLAGESMHKRGYRPLQVKAPLNEAIAAGLLLLTGWDRQSGIVDPMCGSGTFVIEAAWLATDTAPGLGRRFAHERWIDHEAEAWRAVRDEALARRRVAVPFELLGGDRHPGAIEIAKRSARAAGVDKLVRFEHRDVSALVPRQAPGLVVCNPPYGERIGRGDELERTWRALGRFLHDRAQGADAWILSGDRVLTKQLGLRARRRIPVQNANIECRWLGYPIGAEELHFVPIDRAGDSAADSGDEETDAAAPRSDAVPAREPTAAEVPSEGRHGRQQPSEWVLAALPQLAEGSFVLDLACGSGRHVRTLLAAGHHVVGVDRDIAQLGDLLQELDLEPVEHDLEDGGPWPFGQERFDAVVVTNYLWRPLFEDLLAALRPSGILIYETFMDGQERLGRPSRPEHLLRSNELLELCRGHGTVLAFEEGTFDEPEPKCVQRILLRKTDGAASGA